jgi:hypothetical protein
MVITEQPDQENRNPTHNEKDLSAGKELREKKSSCKQRGANQHFNPRMEPHENKLKETEGHVRQHCHHQVNNSKEVGNRRRHAVKAENHGGQRKNDHSAIVDNAMSKGGQNFHLFLPFWSNWYKNTDSASSRRVIKLVLSYEETSEAMKNAFAF